MKRFFSHLAIIFSIFFLLGVGGPGVVQKANATGLQWDANTEPDLAGYKVYYGRISGGPYDGQGALLGSQMFNSPVDVGNVTTVDLDMPLGTWYFVVTAYDSEVPVLESDYSNEVSDIVSNGPPDPPQNLAVRVLQAIMNFFKGLFGGLRVI